MIWSNKNGVLSMMSIFTSILGHVPISSLKLNAFLYSYSKSLTSIFSMSIKHELTKLTYSSSISLVCHIFLLIILFKQGYISFHSSFSSFNVCTHLLIFHPIHQEIQNNNIYSNVNVDHLALSCSSQKS